MFQRKRTQTSYDTIESLNQSTWRLIILGATKNLREAQKNFWH